MQFRFMFRIMIAALPVGASVWGAGLRRYPICTPDLGTAAGGTCGRIDLGDAEVDRNECPLRGATAARTRSTCWPST